VGTGRVATPAEETAQERSEPQTQGAIGDYRIESTIGRGAHGTSYLVSRPDTARRYVLKAFSKARQKTADQTDGATERSEVLRALRRELALLKAARHPGIPEIEDSDEYAAQPYLVMPYKAGETLETRAQEHSGPLPEDELREIALSAAEALEAVHSAGYLHGDLKPSNLYLQNDKQVMLLDFAGAQPLGGSGEAGNALRFATPGFAPLEQCREEAAEGTWTDVYGLAATLYWCIAGFAPAPAPARYEGEGLIPARYLGKGSYTDGFLKAIDRGLALHPEKRPQTPKDFVSLLSPASELPAPPALSRPETAASASVASSSWEPVFDDCPETQRITRAAPSELPSALRPLSEQTPNGSGDAPLRRRRPYWILLILLPLLAGGGWAGWQAHLRYFKTEWIVDASGGGDTATIGEALNLAKAGATLLIREGRYEESLTVHREVSLVGDPDATAKPTIAPASGPCLSATAADATFRNLHFLQSNANRCVVLLKGNFTVEESLIENRTGPGLVAEAGATIALKNITLPKIGGAAIALYDGSVADMDSVEITESAGAGIALRGGSKAAIVSLDIEGAGEAGLLVTEGSEAVISNSSVAKGLLSGAEVREAAKLVAKNLKLDGNLGAGLYVYAEGRAEVDQGVMTRNACCGVIAEPTAYVSLKNSEIDGNAGHGIVFLDTSVGLIEDNRITGNAEHGLLLDDGADVEVGNNTIEGNGGSPVLRTVLKTKEAP